MQTTRLRSGFSSSGTECCIKNRGLDQGDQIGRIFAYWVVIFGKFLITKEAKIFWLLFLPVKICILILTRFLGDFFRKLIWSP
jgi:hypothetical protein